MAETTITRKTPVVTPPAKAHRRDGRERGQFQVERRRYVLRCPACVPSFLSVSRELQIYSIHCKLIPSRISFSTHSPIYGVISAAYSVVIPFIRGVENDNPTAATNSRTRTPECREESCMPHSLGPHSHSHVFFLILFPLLLPPL